jgi:hypothetical protein
VRRGRVGRFIEGLNPGGGCYGYRNVRVEDFTSKGENGLPGIKGMKQEIVWVEAAIVVRIFRSYEAGMSYLQIAEMLNEESIPPPQNPKTKIEPSWSKGAIAAILNNSRYRGRPTEGTTREFRDPETGQKERRDLPESEWKKREAPELRIIDEDLWCKVEEQRKLKTHTIGVQRSGGLSRTAASRKYLLNGKLKCGVCGGAMVIRTSNPTRFGCATHQYRGNKLCRNGVTLRLEDLERVFLHALSENLRSEDLGEELVEGLFQQLQSARSERFSTNISRGEQKKGLEASRGEQARELENLVNFVKKGGSSQTISGAINSVEASIARIDEILKDMLEEPVQEFRKEEVREFVNSQVHSLEKLLLSSPETLKNEFQRRISAIILTPIVDERGAVYQVTGDVDLFSLPDGVLQPKQV